MRLLEHLGLSWFFELILELTFWYALVFASMGLFVAYIISSQLNLNHEVLSWFLALCGFAFGIRYDLAALKAGPSRESIAIIGYIGFAAFLMSVEVMLVLHIFRVDPL